MREVGDGLTLSWAAWWGPGKGGEQLLSPAGLWHNKVPGRAHVWDLGFGLNGNPMGRKSCSYRQRKRVNHTQSCIFTGPCLFRLQCLTAVWALRAEQAPGWPALPICRFEGGCERHVFLPGSASLFRNRTLWPQEQAGAVAQAQQRAGPRPRRTPAPFEGNTTPQLCLWATRAGVLRGPVLVREDERLDSSLKWQENTDR